MDWELQILTALRDSRTSWDEPADWRAVLALYDGLSPTETAALDRALIGMIDIGYRNRHSAHERQPYDQIEVNLPLGMSPDDLLCIEAAVLVAAERGLAGAFFPFTRLMSLPAWHLLQGRLTWLAHEGFAAQRRLGLTRSGRGLGALLGTAVADALGCTVEFMGREQIAARYPGGHREIIGGGPFGFPAGSGTDDTAMALAVGRGIVDSPDDPVDAVGRHCLAWFEGGPPDVGSTCRLAITTYWRTESWSATSRHVAAELGKWAGGNGALMRTQPTALAYGADVTQAIRIGRMTHPHPESDAAIAIYHRMLNALLDGATKAEALAVGLNPDVAAGGARIQAGPGAAEPGDGGLDVEGARLAQGIAALAERFREIADRPADAIQAGGYVVETLEAALWAFLRTNGLEECVTTAVNLGDDADTVGAVAGGLAGAAYGPFAVPRRWSQALTGRAALDQLAEGLYGVYCTRFARD